MNKKCLMFCALFAFNGFAANDLIRFIEKARCRDDRVDKFEKLIQEGNDIDQSELNTGQTPLHIACWMMDEKIVKTLLDWGAKVNVYSKWGQTPLMYAIEKSPRIVKLLLANGAVTDNIIMKVSRYCLIEYVGLNIIKQYNKFKDQALKNEIPLPFMSRVNQINGLVFESMKIKHWFKYKAYSPLAMEIWSLIFSYLEDPKNYLATMRICKELYNVPRQSNTLKNILGLISLHKKIRYLKKQKKEIPLSISWEDLCWQ